MTTIAATEARGNLARLLLQAETGEEIVIVNGGEPLARLAPPETGHDVERARLAIRRLREFARQHPIPNLTIEEIKSWIEEGRP